MQTVRIVHKVCGIAIIFYPGVNIYFIRTHTLVDVHHLFVLVKNKPYANYNKI